MIALLTVFLPFFAFLVIFLKRFILPRNISVQISLLISGLQLICAYYTFYFLKSIYLYNLGNWILVGTFKVDFLFLFDPLTSVMLVLVSTISFLVQLYSVAYMSEDPELPLFMSYLSLFAFFMLVLVSAGNFALMFLGWEGVGLASYLLINFWHTRIASNKAAVKAVIVNKVGDIFLMIAMAGLFYQFKSLDYFVIFCAAPTLTIPEISIFTFSSLPSYDFVCLFILAGAAAKSAQLGLHTWLPDAMEGPSPVSALIHAATMVTAGVFLLVRCSPILEFSPLTLSVCVILGSVTAFFAASTGLFQNDIKRVIAYSTCSQLGYMIFACGLSGYNFAMFHLFNHGFFKALLFLSAGSVIHALSDEQDMRRMGGLTNLLPLTYVSILIGSLSLMGFPFLTGFYSKDAILELAYASHSPYAFFAYILGSVSAFLTAFYSMRLIYLTFYTKPNSYRSSMLHVHEAPLFMAIPLVILCLGSIFVGYLGFDLFIGLGTSFWGTSIFILPENSHLDFENIPTIFKLFPVILSLTGAFTGYVLYNSYFQVLLNLNLKDKIVPIYRFFSYKWYFDVLYNYFIVNFALFFGHNVTYEILDRGVFELIGPLGISRLLTYATVKLSNLQSGFLYHYIFTFIIGVLICILSIYFFNPVFLFQFVNINLLILSIVLVLVPIIIYKFL